MKVKLCISSEYKAKKWTIQIVKTIIALLNLKIVSCSNLYFTIGFNYLF